MLDSTGNHSEGIDLVVLDIKLIVWLCWVSTVLYVHCLAIWAVILSHSRYQANLLRTVALAPQLLKNCRDGLTKANAENELGLARDAKCNKKHSSGMCGAKVRGKKYLHSC